MTDVRTRFAPSPTGSLHLGNLRVAVFNWLFARRHGGRFVVRLEDTDVERNVPGSEERILDDLAWAGIDWDEGPDVDGPFGPYRQSEREERHRTAARRLTEADRAYPCYCTDGELDAQTVELPDGRVIHRYSGRCRGLSEEERRRMEAEGRRPAIRFAVPPGEVAVQDEVRGEILFPTSDFGDFVILRRDGRPTYNFAVVVDDVGMRISHVIRGAGHLSNTPRQALLFDALDAPRPVFAHLPTVLGPDRRKLSKRTAGISVADFRAEGLHPDAVVNYVSLLGWSPGDDREVLGREELVALIDLARVGASNTVYDPEKLRWMSAQHLARMTTPELVEAVAPWLPEELPVDRERLPAALEVLRTRLRTFGDVREHLEELADLSPEEREELTRLLVDDAGARRVLATLRQQLGEVASWQPEALGQAVRAAGKEAGARGKSLFLPVRMGVTGRSRGPDLSGILSALGPAETLRRLDRALDSVAVDDETGGN